MTKNSPRQIKQASMNASLRKGFFLAILSLLLGRAAQAQLPAFPGAEGFGAHAIGGRYGDVYTVTNLNSSGAGSLRYGVENAPSTGRTIVFAVSGYIPISNNSDTGNKTLRIVQNKITIAGQTAPGDGIGLKDGRILITGNDTIIRHLRIRHGKNGGAGDCCNIEDRAQNTILDHVSMQFGTDEIISMYDSSPVDKVTMQSSIAAWGLESHNKGGLWSVQNASCIDSLWAHNTDRNPKAQPWGMLEWINNVTHNYGVGFQMGSTSTPASFKANVIGNYFIHSRYGDSSLALEQARIDRNGNYNFSLWLDDCLHDSNIENYPSSNSGVLNGTNKGFSIVEGSAWQAGQNYSEGDYIYFKRTSPHPGATGNIAASVVDPLTALKKVVSDVGALRLDASYGGAIRDAVDTLLIDDVLNQRRRQINGEYNLPISNDGFGTLNTIPALSDRDGDGMPDVWENTLGYQSTTPDHNKVLASTSNTFLPSGTPLGYTSLEEYLHFKALPHAIIGKNTSQQPSKLTVDLRKYVSGFSKSPRFSLSAISGGTIEQFAANGVTRSPTGPIVTFTPTLNTQGRAQFDFTVIDSEASSWKRSFVILVTASITKSPRVRINVDFDKGSPYSGRGAAPDSGTFWNIFNAQATNQQTITNATAADGTPSGLNITLTADGNDMRAWSDSSLGNPTPSGLMDDYFYGNTYTVTISKLPAGDYELYVYAHGDQADQNSTVTIHPKNGGASATLGSTGTQYRNINTSSAEGYAYLKFKPVVGTDGTLTFSAARYLNAFQLITPLEQDYAINLTNDAGNTGTTQTIGTMAGWEASGAIRVPGETWNVFNESDYNGSSPSLSVGQSWTICREVPLTTLDGTGAGSHLSVVYYAATDPLTGDRLSTVAGSGVIQESGVLTKLMRNYWDRNGSGNFQRFTLDGLEPSTNYLLCVYAGAGAAQSWSARIDLDQNGSVDLLTKDSLASDALFTSQGGGTYVPTPQGELWNSAVIKTNSLGELSFDSKGHLSGFQVISYQTPTIDLQPKDQQVDLGNQATFTIEASARPEPSYQWYHNDLALSGATKPQLIVTNVSEKETGKYHVEVSNNGQTITSNPAVLTIANPYLAYVMAYGLNSESSGLANADPDQDGVPNIIEFFLGRNPTRFDPLSTLPQGFPNRSEPLGIVFQFNRHQSAKAVPFEVEYTHDFETIQKATHGQNGVTIQSTPLNPIFDQITVTIPAEESRIFVWLKL